VTGVQLWSLRFAGAPTGSHHFAGGAMDVPLRLFGWRANVLAAARYIRERYGKPWTGWPVHAHYSDPRLQQRLSRMTLAERARRHRVLEAINETGRGAEEVQWAWPSS
jgi:hypothetical protein